MKALAILCILFGVNFINGYYISGYGDPESFCRKLKWRCNNGRENITYCAFNKNSSSYETVEKPVACMMYDIKCTESKNEKPLHKGACGNCSKSNVCWNSPGKFYENKKFFEKKGYGDEYKDNEDYVDESPCEWSPQQGRHGVCGTDGKRYDNMCNFTIARCQAYKKSKTLVFPESCRKRALCKKLAGVCANGTSRQNMTYCKWNTNIKDFETVTNGRACFLYGLKCDNKHPMYRGECRNCTQSPSNNCYNETIVEEEIDEEDYDEDGDEFDEEMFEEGDEVEFENEEDFSEDHDDDFKDGEDVGKEEDFITDEFGDGDDHNNGEGFKDGDEFNGDNFGDGDDFKFEHSGDDGYSGFEEGSGEYSGYGYHK